MLRYLLVNNKMTRSKFITLIKTNSDDYNLELALLLMTNKNNCNDNNIFDKYLQIMINNSKEELIYEVLLVVCKMGNLKQFKQIYKNIKNPEFNINENNELLFRKACTSGNLLFVKYLVEESNKRNTPININAYCDNAFKRACKHNNNQIVKYLYYLSLKMNKPININLGSNFCFRIACKSGNEFLVKFLYAASKVSGIPININILNDEAFRWACTQGHYGVANLLWKISKQNKTPINVKYNDNQIFTEACVHNHIDIINLLMKMVPNYYYATINDNKVVKFGLLTDTRKSLSILQDASSTSPKKGNPCNILGIKKTINSKNIKDNYCNICYSNAHDISNNNKLVRLCCEHVYCLECLLITHNQQEEDDSDYYNYDAKLKCFKSSDPYLQTVQCTYCKKQNIWAQCVIVKLTPNREKNILVN